MAKAALNDIDLRRMSSRRIGWSIFGAVVLINALVLVFAGTQLRQDREELEVRAELQTQNLAQAIDQSVSTKIEKIDLFLRLVARELERELSAGGIDKERIQSLFGGENRLLYEASPIRVTDAAGNVILDGDGDTEPRSYAAREFFSYLRSHPDSGLFISKPVTGLLTGRWIIPFTLAYHRPDGAFAGVVAVTIRTESFGDLISRFDPGERGLITLRDSDLAVVASIRLNSGARLEVGDRNVSPLLKARAASGVRQASFRARPPFDEYRRTVTFRRLERAPMYVLVGMEEGTYLAPWYRGIPWLASYLAIFLLVTSLSAWAFWRVWLRQARSTEALRQAHEQLSSSIAELEQTKTDLAKYASIVESSEDAIHMRSPDFRTLIWNPAAERMFGYKAGEVIGKSSRFLVPPEHRSEVEGAHAILAEGRPVPTGDTVRLTKDGRRVHVSVSRFPVKDANGSIIGASFIYRDITERKRAEQALRSARDELERRVIERTEQLRRLAVEATLTEETERRSIARDLHDGLGQTLHVIRLKLDALAKTAPEAAQHIVRALIDQIADASRMVRSLTSELSPPALAELGLVAALRWVCGEMERSFGLEVLMEDDGSEPLLTKAQSAIVFRAVRELLINIARHADTARAWISLRASDGVLSVTVKDQGAGMRNPEEALAGGKGWGLASVRERMAYLGSRVEISSSPGRGTTVTLAIRLEPQQARRAEASA